MRLRCFGVLLLIHTALANVTSTKNDSSTISVTNATNNEVINVTKAIPPNNEVKVTKLKISRRKNRKSRSTSSSSGEKGIKGSKSGDKSSLEIQSSDASSSTETKNDTTTYGTGWRRWHRKCTPCPVEMGKRWRDPTIGWICGGFQRARRSFKSECMMHFRNCQDGTMFVKIHSQQCSDTQPGNFPRGRHWFYDYKVVLTDDSTDSESSESTDGKSSESTDSVDSLSLG